MRAAHAHRVGKLGFELLDVELHALLPAAIDGGNKRAADEHRVRTERERLEHVHTAADCAVDKNRHLAADGIDCTHLCFTDAARTPVVFSGAGKLLPYRAPSAELLYAPEQLDAAALRGAFALCFSSGCLLDSPARLTHLKAIAAARDAGAFVCYAPRMAEAAPCWPDAAALRETALQFFPQADVLLLKDSDLVPLFGSHELRTALFSLFSGHVELIFYSSSDDIFLFTRNVLLQAATSDLTEAQFLRDLARLNTWPDKLAGLRETTLKKLFL